MAKQMKNQTAELLKKSQTLLRHKKYAEVVALLSAPERPFPAGHELCEILGRAHIGLGACEAAIKCFHQNIQNGGKTPDTLCFVADALRRNGQLNEAAEFYKLAFEMDPNHQRSCIQLGIAMTLLNRHDVAVQLFRRAIEIDPKNATGHYNLAVSLDRLGAVQDALDTVSDAIRVGMSGPEPYTLKAHLLRRKGRLREASDLFALAGKLDPGDENITAETFQTASMLADWRGQGDLEKWLDRQTPAGQTSPFLFLARQDNPRAQLERSRAYASAQYPNIRAAIEPYEKPAGEPIKIGYFSTDYHDHAVMRLMNGLFAAHNRARVEVFAYSYDIAPEDDMRRVIMKSVDHYKDVARLTDDQIAALARNDRIDIAVDLNGYTEKGRLGIFAQRAAPAQVTWLGYPGTTGAAFMNYVIADDITVPPELEHTFSETVLRLPHSYQINDDQRAVSDRVFTRAELGLPEKGFVFCGFNAVHKICPQVFKAWMSILAQVEGSVLWLICGNEDARRNFRKSAKSHGIAPERIVFGDHMSQANHLARQAVADLFLDTFIYNGHTTASDALWVGLPVLTRIGQQFSARVAASLLTAHGMPELITTSDDAYIVKAVEIAKDRKMRLQLREKAERLRKTSPLFDTRAFAADLEDLYGAILRKPQTDHVMTTQSAPDVLAPHLNQG